MPNQKQMLMLKLTQVPGTDMATDIHHTVTDITSERDLLMLNQKQKHLLTQAHGADMEDTDIEATDMVDITVVDTMVDMVIHTGMVDTTDTASKCYPTPTTSPNIQHCLPSCKRIF